MAQIFLSIFGLAYLIFLGWLAWQVVKEAARKREDEKMRKTYGYGIVDRNGDPWWEEACVCQDRGPLDDEVANLNEERADPRYPYRVVKLYLNLKLSARRMVSK